MTSPQQLEILDLRHFNAKQLRPLLEQEAALWLSRLRWDYRTSTDLLLQYLDSRILPGFVALHRGRICAYTFCVYEGNKVVVGDLYASTDPTMPPPLAVCHTLAENLLDTLIASPDINRIEAQLLLFDSGMLAPLFESLNPNRRSFTVFPRLFLEYAVPTRSSAPAVPSDMELVPWAAPYYQPTGELIYACYAGHIDSSINDQYRSLAGALRFLHNVVRFPGCGVFDPKASWLLRHRATNVLVGGILCSRVAPDVAHVTQLCVLPNFRGRNLGRILLASAIEHMPAQRYRAVTLTVTEANTSALALYLAAGFTTRHRFDALVLDKPAHRLRLVI